MKISENILYYGKRSTLPKKIDLRAGNLNLIYQKGFLRNIKIKDQEILKQISHAIRDQNWNTLPFNIIDEEIEKKTKSFFIKYRCEVKQNEVVFLWQCTIRGEEDNSLSFEIDGEALVNFKRNRAGFSVLHPIKGCAGKEVQIKRSDGSIHTYRFPLLISPHQPFGYFNQMEWKVDSGNAILLFSGDVFETEDQRNWTDDSYKTYCTPLDLPFPVQLKKGEIVHQKIKLIVDLDAQIQFPKPKQGKLTLCIEDEPKDLPKLGIGSSSTIANLSNLEVQRIKKIPFDHYQVDIMLYKSNWEIKWKKAIYEGKSLGLPMEISLFFNNTKEEFERLKSIIESEKPNIALVNLFSKNSLVTQKGMIDEVVQSLRSLLPDAKIGVGTNAFFAELNRDRPPVDKIDFLVYSLNPQVHAFDNDSLVETINAQPSTVETAKSFSNGKPVHISPITLKMRWNPNATNPSISCDSHLPANFDVRQMSLFGACWLLGTISSLSASTAGAITFFETIGLGGIMQSNENEYEHDFFAPAGSIYPMYFVFKFLLKNKPKKIYPLVSTDPMQTRGLFFLESNSSIYRVMLCNYTGKEITVNLRLPIDYLEVCTIDATTLTIAMNDYNFLERTDYWFTEVEKNDFVVTIKPYGIIYGKGSRYIVEADGN